MFWECYQPVHGALDIIQQTKRQQNGHVIKRKGYLPWSIYLKYMNDTFYKKGGGGGNKYFLPCFGI